MVVPLKIDRLVKNYGQLCAVNEVDFRLQSGEVFGLLGPNGAGKTSIISIIVTLEAATSGSVEVFGYDVAKQPRQAKVRMGLVPQEIINYGFFSVEEVMVFHSGFYGMFKNRERENYLLERLGLWEHRHKKVKQLSGGMKRRLLIAKALVHCPQLLLLDEPTAGVDIELREKLWEFVRDLKSEGVTVLLTTHYLEEAEQLCDRIGVIHHGVLQKLGETKTLIADLTHRQVTVDFKRQGDDKSAFKVQSHYLVKQEGYRIEFKVPAQMGIGQLLRESGLNLNLVEDIKIEEGSLEDAFRSIVGARQ